MIKKIVGIIVIVIAVAFIVIAVNAQTARSACSERAQAIERKRADLDARSGSIGGILDLNGDVESARQQFNLDVRQYNTDCT
jgi:hypothetical protein